jgi:hypothetical protein
VQLKAYCLLLLGWGGSFTLYFGCYCLSPKSNSLTCKVSTFVLIASTMAGNLNTNASALSNNQITASASLQPWPRRISHQPVPTLSFGPGSCRQRRPTPRRNPGYRTPVFIRWLAVGVNPGDHQSKGSSEPLDFLFSEAEWYQIGLVDMHYYPTLAGYSTCGVLRIRSRLHGSPNPGR